MSANNIERKLDRILDEVLFIKGRTATYLGNGEALGFLVDETPIFVNTADIGCPINVLNGGRYEESYLRVLASYRTENSTFLDVGANLGVYSLRMAPMLRSGRIIAFEPIKRVRELFSRSIFLNNLTHRIELMPFALSDRDGEATLHIPAHHAGGASLEVSSGIPEAVQIRALDSLMHQDFTCDLVKIDVEGHEFKALKGMEGVLRRSPDCIVLFEKLAQNAGYEQDIFEFVSALRWGTYFVDGLQLSRVDLPRFQEGSGYFVAGSPQAVEREGLVRDFFDIFPSDLHVLVGRLEEGNLDVSQMPAAGELVFHGPYWYLPRGYYQLEFLGELSDELVIDVTQRFGHQIECLRINGKKRVAEFAITVDICQFELACRSRSRSGWFRLRKFRIKRLG